MWTDTLLFYFFALLVLGGGVLTITRRSPVYSAISLIVSLLGVAGLFLMQQAEFLFAIQIIVYVGGIVVLFLFVIMLVNLEESARRRQFNHQWMLALAAVLLLGLSMIWLLRTGASSLAIAPPRLSSAPNTETIALVLFSEYLLPFELASVLLLVAIIGSVLLAKLNRSA